MVEKRKWIFNSYYTFDKMKNLTQIFNEDDLIGKTITKVIDEDSLILMFENDEFAVIHSYDGSENVYVDSSAMTLTHTGYNHHTLFEMGLMTKEQIDEIANKRKEQSEAQAREAELQQLARLRAKYPELI